MMLLLLELLMLLLLFELHQMRLVPVGARGGCRCDRLALQHLMHLTRCRNPTHRRVSDNAAVVMLLLLQHPCVPAVCQIDLLYTQKIAFETGAGGGEVGLFKERMTQTVLVYERCMCARCKCLCEHVYVCVCYRWDAALEHLFAHVCDRLFRREYNVCAHS